MLENLRELYQYRELIRVLVQRDLQVRYKNSVLGFLWSLGPMLMQVAIITLIIGKLHRAAPNLGIYILCAYIPWNFLSASLMDGASSVANQFGLLKKIYFPRELLPISAVLANLIHMGLALVVFIVYRWGITPLFAGHPGWPPREVLWLPVLMAMTFFLVLGIVFFLSAWNVFHEDVKFITQNILQLSFFALPIFWFAEEFFYGRHIYKPLRHGILILYNANPVSWIISAFKEVLLPRYKFEDSAGHLHPTQAFDYRYFAWNLAVTVVIAVSGYAYFNRRKWQFVERP